MTYRSALYVFQIALFFINVFITKNEAIWVLLGVSAVFQLWKLSEERKA